jgi:hypothetical protein
MIEYKIYGLYCPLKNELRYVGQTKQPSLRNRYNYHINEKTNTRKNQWIRSLKSKSLKPEMFVIDTCSSLEECNELEIFWIAYFKSIGCRLTNVSYGGGSQKGIKQSPEIIAKRAQKMIGKKCSEETKRKISESNKKVAHVIKEKLSKIAKERDGTSIKKAIMAAKEKYLSLSIEERKERYKKREENKKLRGTNKVTDETRKRLSEAQKGRQVSPETREKIRQSLLGKKHTPERISNFTEGLKKAIEKRKNKNG